MFIKEEIFLNNNNSLIPTCNWFYSANEEKAQQARLYVLKNFVEKLEEKSSWAWTKTAVASPVFAKGFCVSSSLQIYYNEIYFINNNFKHSFFYKSLSRDLIVNANLFKKNFEFNVERFLLPRSTFYNQQKNLSYNYLKIRPYCNSLEEQKTEVMQRITLKKNFLTASFSNDKFSLMNFFRVSRFSKKNKIFLLTLYHRIKRRWLLTLCGQKKKIRRRLPLLKRYKYLKNAILKRLKKGKMPFFTKLTKVKKRFLAKKKCSIKSGYLRKKLFYSKLRSFYSGGRSFKRILNAKKGALLKSYVKKKIASTGQVFASSYEVRVLSSALTHLKVSGRRKKIGRFLKKKVV